jgi:hypothetical protein
MLPSVIGGPGWFRRPSMGSVGDAHDNAMCENFFATLECRAASLTAQGAVFCGWWANCP